MDINNPSAVLYGQNDYINGVTSVADGTAMRLQVQAVPAGGVVPNAQPFATAPMARTVWQPLLNGTNSNLLVNGSAASPVLFTYPSANAPMTVNTTISRLKFVYSVKSMGFTGNQITSVAGLLGLGANVQALPNGLLVGGTFGGVSTTMAKIQINEDFFSLNGPTQFVGGDAGRMCVTELQLMQPMVAGSSDQFVATVQDNMANISTANTLRIFVSGVRTLS